MKAFIKIVLFGLVLITAHSTVSQEYIELPINHEGIDPDNPRFVADNAIINAKIISRRMQLVNELAEKQGFHLKKPVNPQAESLQNIGCTVQGEIPMGHERKSGGLNGVAYLYQCNSGYTLYIETFYYNEPLVVRVTNSFADGAVNTKIKDYPAISRFHKSSVSSRSFYAWHEPERSVSIEVIAPDIDITFNNQILALF